MSTERESLFASVTPRAPGGKVHSLSAHRFGSTYFYTACKFLSSTGPAGWLVGSHEPVTCKRCLTAIEKAQS